MQDLALIPIDQLLQELSKRMDSLIFMGTQKGYYINNDEKTVWNIVGDTKDAVFMLELLRIKIMSDYVQHEQQAEDCDG